MTARSLLYVPGDDLHKLQGALDRGADGVIVDLEDAVPVASKDAAREAVAEWLARVDSTAAQIWVRVNPGPLREADIRAVAGAAALTGIYLAKADRVADVEQADRLLTDVGSAALLVPLLESARAVLAAPELAVGPRVVRLQLGEADLRAEMGLEPGDDETELLWARSRVVFACAAAGTAPPMGSVETDVRDLDRLRRTTRALRRLGFWGRACIHPAQVPLVMEEFTYTAAERARARDVVERFEQAGSGVALDARGRLIDEPVVKAARRVLAAYSPVDE
jgi:citrate lyase subunit beta/citryl-CoA lyase